MGQTGAWQASRGGSLPPSSTKLGDPDGLGAGFASLLDRIVTDILHQTIGASAGHPKVSKTGGEVSITSAPANQWSGSLGVLISPDAIKAL